jgi:hypothetical protein
MKKRIQGLAVSMLAVMSVVGGSAAAMAVESPTFYAKAVPENIDVTTFNVGNAPLGISTADVATDDSAGCVIGYVYETTPDNAGIIEGTGKDVSATATDGKFSEYTYQLGWAAEWEAEVGKKVEFGFFPGILCSALTLGTDVADSKITLNITADTTDPREEEEETAETVDAPGAPATATVSDINPTNAKVTWTAPTTGGAVTSYVVLVGTTNVGTFGPTVLTATLTGLEPNKDYTVTVKAVNAGGEGTKTATFKTVDTTKSGKVELAAKTGETIAGTKSTITATGLKPGADYTIVLRSDPVTLASGKVADNGNLTQEVTLPTIAEGSHSITLTSTYWDGTALSSVIYFTVDADGKLTEITTTAPELAETGLNLILPIGLALALAAAGAVFVVNGVRRRATATM